MKIFFEIEVDRDDRVERREVEWTDEDMKVFLERRVFESSGWYESKTVAELFERRGIGFKVMNGSLVCSIWKKYSDDYFQREILNYLDSLVGN